MSALATPEAPLTSVTGEKPSVAAEAHKRLSSPWASLAAVVIAVLWTIPTFGLFITSFRPQSDINSSGWWEIFTNPSLTLDNYRLALSGDSTANFSTYFINSVVITVPAVVIPITIAALAAYAFAWMRFPFRDGLFVAVFALQVVPLQVALLPLLKMYTENLHLARTFWTLWLSHSIFALPLAIYLLHNFMKQVPNELIEAARVDGATHVTIFTRLMLPLVMPAIAAFGIFQFLWVWNDLLVALTFAGGTQNVAPLTVRLANLSGTRGADWHLLSAGAFISLVVPAVVFISMQRYFVRGLLAGSVKG